MKEKIKKKVKKKHPISFTTFFNLIAAFLLISNMLMSVISI